MQEFKGTPGPWEVGEIMAEQGFVYCDDSLGSAVCRFDLIHTFGITQEQKQANGHLLAAAPDMLEALLKMKEVYESKGQLLAYDVSIALRAINKALNIK